MNLLLRILISSFLIISLGACSDAISETNDGTEVQPIVAQAELISLDSADVGPPSIPRMWQYKIQFMTPENSMVKKGDVIIRFDGDNLSRDLITLQSDLAAEIKRSENERLDDQSREQDLILAEAEAQMNFEKAERKVAILDTSLSRIEKEKQQAEYDIADARLKQASNRLKQHRVAMALNQQVSEQKVRLLENKVDTKKKDLGKLVVKAPKDGLVTYDTDWNGDKASIGETVYMGRNLITLPSLDEMSLSAEFSEPDTERLFEGQTVKVIFEVYPEKSFQGRIESLGQAYFPKTSNSSKVMFKVVIELGDDKPEIMRPGMKAKIEVEPKV